VLLLVEPKHNLLKLTLLYIVNPEFTFIAPKTVTYSDERFNSLYQTNREIGAGAYGTVSLCVCKKTGKRVAVKIIDLVKCKSETVGTSLLREVSICMAFPVHVRAFFFYLFVCLLIFIFPALYYTNQSSVRRK
jgi:hypothetical protein